MSGGTLTGGGALVNNATFTGYGTINANAGFSNNGTMTLKDGASTVNGDFNNQATGNLYIQYQPATFTGNVVNYGYIKVTQTTDIRGANYTEYGT